MPLLSRLPMLLMVSLILTGCSGAWQLALAETQIAIPVETATATDGMTEAEALAAVLKEPASVALSLQLAGIQLREAALGRAAATLERVYLLTPENMVVAEMLMEVMLLRGNRVEAKRFARIIRDHPKATPAQRNQATEVLANLFRQDRPQWNGMMRLGMGVSRNPARAPREGRAVVYDLPAASSLRQRTEEYAGLTIVAAYLRPLNSQSPSRVHITFSTQGRDYASFQQGDLVASGVQLGLDRQSSGQTRWQVMTGASRIHLRDRHYASFWDIGGRLDRQFGDEIMLFSMLRLRREVMKDIIHPSLTGRTGFTGRLENGFTHQLEQASMGGIIHLAGEDRNQRHTAHNSLGLELFISFASRFGLSRLSCMAETRRYRAIDGVYSLKHKRREDRAGLSLDHHIGLFGGRLAEAGQPYLSFSGRFARTDANIANFSHDSGEVSMQLTIPF